MAKLTTQDLEGIRRTHKERLAFKDKTYLMITGATGTGKTVTLQILAESFSNAGVPVFCADVKGDLSGVAGDHRHVQPVILQRGHRRRGLAGSKARVVRVAMRLVLAPGAQQARNALVRLAGVDAEVSGHVLAVVFAHDRAIGGLLLARHQGLGERAASGPRTGSAIRARQQFLDAVDARVLPDPESLVDQRDDEAEKQAHAAQDQGRVENGVTAHRRALAFADQVGLAQQPGGQLAGGI
mgnify:CR=1 FL=1